MRTALTLATLAAGVLAACGGSETPSGVPTDDPEAVVRVHVEAFVDCGEDAARRLVESSTANTEGLSDEEAVEAILEDQSEEGCTPEPTGEIETFLTSQGEDVAMVEVRIPEGPEEGTYNVRAVRTDEGWLVDATADEL